MTEEIDEQQADTRASKNGRDKVTLSGRELIVLVIFTPVVYVWLFL
jgi:hypothetical protein